MRFATVGQVLAMVLVWAAALFGIDYTKNPHLWNPAAVGALPAEGVHLRLWIDHLCCTGCLADVVKALGAVSSLGVPRPQPGLMPEGAAKERTEGLGEYGGYVDVPVKQVDHLDLVMIDRVLRDVGLVPRRMEVGGLEHFRLVAEIPHLCCGICKAGLDDGFSIVKAQAVKGQFAWLDSVTVSRERKTITAYARYLERGKTVDIGEFLAGLNFVGFAPSYVKVVVESENPPKAD